GGRDDLRSETGNGAGKRVARRFRHALRVGVFERRGPNHQLGADGARHSFESFRASRRQTAPAMLGRNGAKVTEDELGVVIAFEGSEANDFTAPLDDDAVYTSALADLAKLNFLEVKAFS